MSDVAVKVVAALVDSRGNDKAVVLAAAAAVDGRAPSPPQVHAQIATADLVTGRDAQSGSVFSIVAAETAEQPQVGGLMVVTNVQYDTPNVLMVMALVDGSLAPSVNLAGAVNALVDARADATVLVSQVNVCADMRIEPTAMTGQSHAIVAAVTNRDAQVGNVFSLVNEVHAADARTSLVFALVDLVGLPLQSGYRLRYNRAIVDGYQWPVGSA